MTEKSYGESEDRKNDNSFELEIYDNFINKNKTEISFEEHKRIVKHLSDELIRKDEIIKNISERNNILIRTTVRQAEKMSDMLDKIKQLNSQCTRDIKKN